MSNQKKVVLSSKTSLETKKLVGEIAEKWATTPSRVIERAILEFLARNPPGKGP